MVAGQSSTQEGAFSRWAVYAPVYATIAVASKLREAKQEDYRHNEHPSLDTNTK
jgi:hypothetical protein